MTCTLALPVLTASDTSKLDHVYCCDPDVALCGADLSDHVESSMATNPCVLCIALEEIGIVCGTAGCRY